MLRKLIRKLGFDVVRFPYRVFKTEVSIVNEWRKNRFKLILHNKIDLVLDVGANDGHYALELRNNGYKNQIMSFEPLQPEFLKLKQRAFQDDSWEAYNFALGDLNARTEINIAGNSQSSSILEMGAVHLASAPDSAYVGKQSVEVRRLDDLFANYKDFENIYLKLDVQGYEEKVLSGLENNLSRIDAIQIEMSLTELYVGEKTFFDQCKFLLARGFKLMSVEPGFYDTKTGQLLQVDGIWFR